MTTSRHSNNRREPWRDNAANPSRLAAAARALVCAGGLHARRVPGVSVCVLLLLLSGCTGRDTGPLVLAFEDVASPAGAGSGEPNLFVSKDDRLYMSWIEQAGDAGHALKFAVRERNGWTEPRTIATGDKWFVNWADFPSVVVSAGGSMAAHWLSKSDEATFAYDIHVAHSGDGGTSWTDPFKPHTDGTKTEHGFVSMLPWSDGRVLLAWLDGRKFAVRGQAGGEGGASADAGAGSGNGAGDNDGAGGDGGDHGVEAEMTFRTAMMDAEGNLYNERSLDERVCDCCQTSGVRTSNGAVFAYRDRSQDEVRDVSIARFYKGEWQEPRVVSDDGWKIAGCPVNGPRLASHKNRVALAWFTNANETPRVKIMFSTDEGETFGPPAEVDDGDPMGRVDVVMLRDGSAVVSWMEYVDDGAEIRLRCIRPDGKREPSVMLVRSSRERAAGFPQMARAGDEIYMAWTVPGEASVIRTAVAGIGR